MYFLFIFFIYDSVQTTAKTTPIIECGFREMRFGYILRRSNEITLVILNPVGVGGTPHDGLYREAPPERGTFFRLQLCEREGISLVEV